MFITSTVILKMPTIFFLKKKICPNNSMECVPIKVSVQPGHPLILISHCCFALSWSLSVKVFFMQAKKTELMHWQIRVFSTCWFSFFRGGGGFIHRTSILKFFNTLHPWALVVFHAFCCLFFFWLFFF